MSVERDDDGLVRLQKLLARSGVASRRKCEELMLAGEVEVDGEVVTRLGTKVDPTTAVIRVDGPRLPPVSAARLPRAQQAARRRLHDVRPGGPPHAHRLRRRPARAALPRRPARHRHRRADPADQRRRLRAAAGAPVVRGGQDLRRRGRGRRRARRRSSSCWRASCSTTARSRSRRRRSALDATASESIVELVIHEGRNRIVRRLLDDVGHPVRRLTRTAIGPVRLAGLKSGELRELDASRARRAARRGRLVGSRNRERPGSTGSDPARHRRP